MKTSVLIAIFLVVLASASEAGHCGYRDQGTCTSERGGPSNCYCNKGETKTAEKYCTIFGGRCQDISCCRKN